ncbi:hypothetical protein [Halobacillus karajensis]|uniref:Uncharacterized protein n=1 Tax=Halobacillus karajensis TaxID=195088 RepID=A0A059NW80_9BACI|nr:hypothetical protein [Halobacillus karajensis]CDQ22585.1 hypothetical protein BN983_00798 [Halobacillus karajensis]CDQ26067.1 hypothetical protein BN981_00278 [Halobacillus karajensis]
MKIKEEQYKKLCAKCEYLIKIPGKRVCPFKGCIKNENVEGGNEMTEIEKAFKAFGYDDLVRERDTYREVLINVLEEKTDFDKMVNIFNELNIIHDTVIGEGFNQIVLRSKNKNGVILFSFGKDNNLKSTFFG